MFSFAEFNRTTQRAACMLLAVVIVSASLSLGALGAQSAAQLDYSVTVTQLS